MNFVISPERRLFTAAFLLTLCLTNMVFAQTTAFTYQGKLTDSGNPANGNYDLQFKLFYTPTVGMGTQAGATLVRNPVAVSAGVFTVSLDFGANVFDGAARYLEIGVRPAGSGNAYTLLAPRQPITSAPYAIQTLNAQQLGGLPASSFLQNTTTQQAGANFNVGGNGTVGGALTAGALNGNGALTLGGIAPPAVAPAGQGRVYFDSVSNKLRVSENGGAFVNLVGATGVGGSGTVSTIPLWSAGTTLGNSVISQSGPNVGIGTTNPLRPLHSVSPTISNEFIMEVANGLPDWRKWNFVVDGGAGQKQNMYLRILNDAGTSGMLTAMSWLNDGRVIIPGNVGIGTAQPSAKLDVLRVDGSSSPAFNAKNDSGMGVRGVNGDETGSFIGGQVGVYGFSADGAGVYGHSPIYAGFFYGRVLITDGLEILSGSCMGCSAPSDRNLKANFANVDPRSILGRLARLPIQSWNYKSEPPNVQHIGPMAQDFRAVFGLGKDDKVINTVDADGVALAAIQGLYQLMQEQERQIERLQMRITRLERAANKRRTDRRAAAR